MPKGVPRLAAAMEPRSRHRSPNASRSGGTASASTWGSRTPRHPGRRGGVAVPTPRQPASLGPVAVVPLPEAAAAPLLQLSRRAHLAATHRAALGLLVGVLIRVRGRHFGRSGRGVEQGSEDCAPAHDARPSIAGRGALPPRAQHGTRHGARQTRPAGPPTPASASGMPLAPPRPAPPRPAPPRPAPPGHPAARPFNPLSPRDPLHRPREPLLRHHRHLQRRRAPPPLPVPPRTAARGGGQHLEARHPLVGLAGEPRQVPEPRGPRPRPVPDARPRPRRSHPYPPQLPPLGQERARSPRLLEAPKDLGCRVG